MEPERSRGSVERRTAARRLVRVVWTIFLSLPMGVVLLWVVALTAGAEGNATGGPGAMEGDVAFWLWAAVGLGGLAGALLLRGRAVATVASAEGAARMHVDEATGAGPAAGAGAVQSYLIIAWALLEAGALFAGVLVFLGADERLLLYAAPVYLIGLALTHPRREWFGAA